MFVPPARRYGAFRLVNLVLWQEVAELVNGQQKPGTQQVVWNGKNHYGAQVGSGVYIYKIVAGDFTKAHSMVLVK